MIAAGIIMALIVAVAAVRAYVRRRDRRSLICLPGDLWAHTMPYEPSARERRQ